MADSVHAEGACTTGGAILEQKKRMSNFRYFGLPSDFRLVDNHGHVISWEPIKSLAQDTMSDDAQVFIGNLPPPPPLLAPSGEQPLTFQQRLMDQSQHALSQSNQTLTFKNPLKVKGIHFDGRLTQLQFEILMIPCLNLRTLELHLVALDHLNLKHTLIRLDSLTNLKISSTNFGPRDAESHNMELILINAMYLINLHFPALKYLALSVPTLFSKEITWTEAILQSLIRNKRTLRSLSIESPFPLFDSPQRNLTSFEFPIHFEQEVKTMSITTFHYSVAMQTASTSFFRKFSLAQTKLQYFHFWVESPPVAQFPIQSLEDIAKNNRASIQTLAVNQLALAGPTEVNRVNEGGSILNGAAFQHCSKLRTLYLMGDIGGEDLIGQSSRRPSFRYFNLLPYSLETLRIQNIMLTLSDTKFISNNLQNLKHLELINIGQEESLGLSFDNLNTIVSKKKLERLDLVGGLNRFSLQVTSDDKGWKNIAKVLFQSQQITWFRAGRDPTSKGFEIIHSEESSDDAESDEDNSYTSSSSSQEGSIVGQLFDTRRSIGGQLLDAEINRHQIHEDDEARLQNLNARTLYGNVKFNIGGTSSDHLNHND